jgi:prepilin peptidase CpaA
VTLILILALAVRQDLVSHRIPNILTLGALTFGIAFHAIGGGIEGLWFSLAGAAVGLAVLMPFYLCKGMAAGDVKLMMAAGAFLGPLNAFIAAIIVLVAGAILAILVVAWRMVAASAIPGHGAADDARSRSTWARAISERFPYAAAIAVGVVTTMWLRGLFQPFAESFV